MFVANSRCTYGMTASVTVSSAMLVKAGKNGNSSALPRESVSGKRRKGEK